MHQFSHLNVPLLYTPPKLLRLEGPELPGEHLAKLVPAPPAFGVGGEGKVVRPNLPQTRLEVSLSLLVLGVRVLIQNGNGPGNLILFGFLSLRKLSAKVSGLRTRCSFSFSPLSILDKEVGIVKRH